MRIPISRNILISYHVEIYYTLVSIFSSWDETRGQDGDESRSRQPTSSAGFAMQGKCRLLGDGEDEDEEDGRACREFVFDCC